MISYFVSSHIYSLSYFLSMLALLKTYVWLFSWEDRRDWFFLRSHDVVFLNLCPTPENTALSCFDCGFLQGALVLMEEVSEESSSVSSPEERRVSDGESSKEKWQWK